MALNFGGTHQLNIGNTGNTGGNFFGGGTSGSNMFNNAQTQQQRNTGGNTPIFGNNAGGSSFGNPQNTSNTLMFGGGNNMFGNNSGNNNMGNPGNTNAGGNFIGNMGGNTNQGGGMFNNMASNNTSGGGMFGANNMGSTNMGNNPGGSMFGGNTGNNMFGGSSNTTTGGGFTSGNTLFNRGNTNPNMGINTMGTIFTQSIAFQNQLQMKKIALQQCIARINSRNLQNIRLDSWNIYKDKQLNQLPVNNYVIKILQNFKGLQKSLKNLKQTNKTIQTKMNNFQKQTYKKLALYKKCLLQTVSHNKLVEQVSNQLQLIEKQMQDYFKPLYNAHKFKKKISIKQPNQFDIKISYDILNKLQILNQRVDDMIACQNTTSEDQIQSTITVFEQLVQYYQNVSCSFKEFSQRYNTLKRHAIQRQRKGGYENVMSKVVGKVQQNFKKQFKYYDLIKEIDQILGEKVKRDENKRLQGLSRYQTNNFKRTF